MCNDQVVFYVVRHGETEFNLAHKVQGWCDSPLTDEGVSVARRLGRGLAKTEFARAYSSDLGRAVQTLGEVLDARDDEIAKQNLAGGKINDIRSDARIREWCYGDLETRGIDLMRQTFADGFETEYSLTELNERLPEAADVLMRGDSSHRAEGFDAIESRIRDFFDAEAKDVSANGGGNVLVVTHSFVIRTLVYMLDRSRVNDPLKYPNASVTRIVYHENLGSSCAASGSETAEGASSSASSSSSAGAAGQPDSWANGSFELCEIASTEYLVG